MTGAFTRNPDLLFPGKKLRQALVDAAGEGQVELVDATRLATRLTGDAIATNLFMVGFAWQRGLSLCPASRSSARSSSTASRSP